MRKVGYARVSSAAQHLDRQLGALRAERCDQIFAEKMSGKSLKGRPQLEKAIDALGTGDVLVVAEWDRATRSMMDGIAIIDRGQSRRPWAGGSGASRSSTSTSRRKHCGGSRTARASGQSPGATRSVTPRSAGSLARDRVKAD